MQFHLNVSHLAWALADSSADVTLSNAQE